MNKKQNGQYMTPRNIVQLLLNEIGYFGPEILKKTIIEPSFGDGSFLTEIFTRIINEGKKQNLTNSQISAILSENVYGIEIDNELFDKTIKSLNEIAIKNGLQVNFNNLKNENTLLFYKNYLEKFDYCVGNPPFVRIHNIENNKKIKEFEFSSGNTDLYVIFYEIGLNLINKNGKLGFITPNSFIKNASQKKFREYLINNRKINKLLNFRDLKVFEDADVYSVIMIIDNENKEKFTYKIMNSDFTFQFNEIYYKNQNPFIWNFGTKEEEMFLEKINNNKNLLSDEVNVLNGISTLADSIFIQNVFVDEDLKIPFDNKNSNDYVYFKNNQKVYKIEKEILKPIVKASRFSGKIKNTYVICPYILKDRKYIGMSEEFLKQHFPLCYQYFLTFKKELMGRSLDKGGNWFWFGRSQGLNTIYQKKLVFSHYINKKEYKINVYELDEDVFVYSGLFTVKKNQDVDFNKIKNVYESNDFIKYCKIVGKPISGNFCYVSSKQIKDFRY